VRSKDLVEETPGYWVMWNGVEMATEEEVRVGEQPPLPSPVYVGPRPDGRQPVQACQFLPSRFLRMWYRRNRAQIPRLRSPYRSPYASV